MAEETIRVLIIDDHQLMIEGLKPLLEDETGIGKVFGANSFEEALTILEPQKVDVVLMDINMPDMDGYEATKHIRLFNPDIPILALTALNSEEIQAKAIACGMNHVITKPYDFGEFKSVILKYLQVLQD